MPKFMVQVTMRFQVNVKAADADDAESWVRDMDDAELYAQNTCTFGNDYEVFELNEEGEIIEPD
jgi:hypothetical protein